VPVYEYRCGGCGRRVSLLVGVTAEPGDEACPHCGSRDLKRLVSRFRRGRSEDARVDELADRLEVAGEPESPAEMREMVREMGKAMDDDMADEMEEMFEADMEEEREP
jgi:putative FmdB family regulatory protein